MEPIFINTVTCNQMTCEHHGECVISAPKPIDAGNFMPEVHVENWLQKYTKWPYVNSLMIGVKCNSFKDKFTEEG